MQVDLSFTQLLQLGRAAKTGILNLPHPILDAIEASAEMEGHYRDSISNMARHIRYLVKLNENNVTSSLLGILKMASVNLNAQLFYLCRDAVYEMSDLDTITNEIDKLNNFLNAAIRFIENFGEDGSGLCVKYIKDNAEMANTSFHSLADVSAKYLTTP